MENTEALIEQKTKTKIQNLEDEISTLKRQITERNESIETLQKMVNISTKVKETP